jgi:predicted Zn-dependent peptidase
MSSTLFQEIREKNGLAYSVYSSMTQFEDSGVFSIYAGTGVSQAPLCLRLIGECIEGVKKTTLTADELRVIQDNLKGTILLSADSSESRMTSIATNDFVLGRYVSLDEICAQIDAVTPQDLRRLAHKLFKDEKRSILALGPRPTPAFRKRLGFVYI